MQASTQPTADTPRHIAIIMDGNGRWARARHRPRTAGHKQGLEAARRTVENCGRAGVEMLTLFAFSSENWQRPRAEVGTLMDLFLSALQREVDEFADNDVRLTFIGDLSAFSEPLRRHMGKAETLTADNNGLRLNIAANYGGRWDLTQAARRLAADAAEGRLSPADITADHVADHLATAGMAEPDLFIRTGGEQRISNFLLWQLAYTELHFTDVLWPDFDAQALQQALDAYAKRQRRFGRTGEQLTRAG